MDQFQDICTLLTQSRVERSKPDDHIDLHYSHDSSPITWPADMNWRSILVGPYLRSD